MSDEELETTNLMKTLMIDKNTEEEEDIVENIEEFEDKLDYLDITLDKRNKLKQICEDIKREEDEKVREYLFKLLQKEID